MFRISVNKDEKNETKVVWTTFENALLVTGKGGGQSFKPKRKIEALQIVT